MNSELTEILQIPPTPNRPPSTVFTFHKYDKLCINSFENDRIRKLEIQAVGYSNSSTLPWLLYVIIIIISQWGTVDPDPAPAKRNVLVNLGHCKTYILSENTKYMLHIPPTTDSPDPQVW